MRWVAVDLHIHTVLSPCAAEEMLPPLILAEALQNGLALIAICDHNAVGNVAAVQQAAGERLVVLPGMEIMTAEEAHILGIFPDIASAERAASEIQVGLPLADRGRSFGTARLADASGRVTGTDPRMLLAACGLGVAAVADLVRRCGGLAIAAHLDRPSFSILSQLGFLPEDAALDAAEISAAGVRAGKVDAFTELGLPLIVSSDSHTLGEIGQGYTEIEMAEPSFDALAEALRGGAARRRLYA